MKFGIFCVVIFVCVVMYALMDTAKKSDEKSGELWEKYLKEKNEKKQEEQRLVEVAIKRDGRKATFDREKIKDAVLAAFKDVDGEVTQEANQE